jgi:hypothetical protein
MELAITQKLAWDELIAALERRAEVSNTECGFRKFEIKPPVSNQAQIRQSRPAMVMNLEFHPDAKRITYMVPPGYPRLNGSFTTDADLAAPKTLLRGLYDATYSPEEAAEFLLGLLLGHTL